MQLIVPIVVFIDDRKIAISIANKWCTINIDLQLAFNLMQQSVYRINSIFFFSTVFIICTAITNWYIAIFYTYSLLYYVKYINV